MKHFTNSLIAAFVATIVLSLLMIMKKIMGVVPEMNPIADLVVIMQNLSGLSIMPVFGWVLHFFIGTVAWGSVYALLYKILPGDNVIKGIIVGLSAWVLMMFTVTPMAGHGLFGLETSKVIPVMSMVLHIIYGAVLGMIYGELSKRNIDNGLR
jgi:Family of unknown function (DUF6789)